jgi:hypothetical protein
MTHYQAYLLAATAKRALKMVDGHDVELWQHERKIAKFNGDPSGDAP